MVKIGDLELGEFPLLLAPMEDVSDPPFRAVCKQNGVDLMYTEFISAEGLIRDAAKSIQKLDIFEYERPIGIQIFGDKEDVMREAAAIADATNPNLVDINYGCPVKNVACKGAGAGLLRDLPKMQRITDAIVKICKKPVTVKTRLGWDDASINIFEAVQRLQDVGVQALTIHARTRAQMYKGQADWSYIARVKDMPGLRIPVFGNGDVDSPERALEYRHRYGVDGIMIGRAAIGYPWIFNEVKHYFATGEKLPAPTLGQRVAVCKAHVAFSVQWKGDKLGIFEMRRHYTNYFRGLNHFRDYRVRLVEAGSLAEVLAILDEVAHRFSDDDFGPAVSHPEPVEYAGAD
ncbi:MAG: tRNA dihydrouridine synthase DusB [Bernardetiaceae bacterium]|jgi:nifR3 family TIM-barrel protein|nr:tRNA dihydrouridine synthase DusB [Bernardetiaceae bacterium]